jgi:hypothetical protein
MSTEVKIDREGVTVTPKLTEDSVNVPEKLLDPKEIGLEALAKKSEERHEEKQVDLAASPRSDALDSVISAQNITRKVKTVNF